MTVMIDGIEYLQAAVAAERLATTETKILMLLRNNALCGELIEGSWLVTTASLACYDRSTLTEQNQSPCRTSCSGLGCGCH